MKKTRAVGIQFAALPYRMAGRKVEILLITSRETRRWVIPKGWPIKRLSPPDGAAKEAAEEAGIIGDIEPSPIGSYRYLKRTKTEEAMPVQVIVFPLKVSGQHDLWKEQGQRDHRWFRSARAAALVIEPNLKRLIREFGKARAVRLFRPPAALQRWLRPQS